MGFGDVELAGKAVVDAVDVRSHHFDAEWIVVVGRAVRNVEPSGVKRAADGAFKLDAEKAECFAAAASPGNRGRNIVGIDDAQALLQLHVDGSEVAAGDLRKEFCEVGHLQTQRQRCDAHALNDFSFYYDHEGDRGTREKFWRFDTEGL